MNLKTSYFNTTLFKANLKRFWWVSAIFFIAFLTFGILPIITDNSIEGFYAMTVIACLISSIMPTILFSYLDNAGSVTCMHAFPIKRKAHYITHIFTAYVLVLVPEIICCLIAAPIAAHQIATGFGSASPWGIWQNLLVTFMYITVMISAGTLGNMVTGNPISAIVFTGIFAAFPYYTEILFKSFVQNNLYGMPSVNEITLYSTRLEQITPFMKWMFAVWAVMFVISWFLYKFRSLETHGDIISFKFLKPIFVGCVSLFLGLLGYFYLIAMLGIRSIFCLLPFGLIGVVISNMLVKKAFTVKGIAKPGIIYIAAVVAVWAVFSYDLTGYEKRVPKASDIASVCIIPSANTEDYDYAGTVNGTAYYYSAPISDSELKFTDSADIENVIKLHKYLTENRNIKSNRFLPITYKLKNGKTLTRSYSYNLYEQYDLVKPIYETKQMRLDKYYIFRDFEKTITNVDIFDSRIQGDNKLFATYYQNDEKTKALYDALKEDIMEADFDTIINYNNFVPIQISIGYIRPIETENGKEYKRIGSELSDEITIGVTDSFKRTLSLLNEYGLSEKRTTPEQIAYAAIFFNYSDTDSVKITDRASIDELYNMPYGTTKNDLKKPIVDGVKDAEIRFYSSADEMLYSRSSNLPSSWPPFMLYEAQRFAAQHPDDTYSEEQAIDTIEYAPDTAAAF